MPYAPSMARRHCAAGIPPEARGRRQGTDVLRSTTGRGQSKIGRRTRRLTWRAKLTLIGKGYFIWQVWNCERGDAQAIAAKARQAGLTHVLVKIGDGTLPYNVDPARGGDLIPPVL